MKFRYDLNDKPNLFPLLLYGLQWLLISIPVVLILSTIVSRFQFTALREQIFYAQKLFFLMGTGLVVQVCFGHKMPVVIGPAAVLLIGVMAASSSSLSVVYTSILVGGGSMALLGMSGWLHKIQFIFTPRIIVVILALIAFTLAPVILNLIFADGERPLFCLCFALCAALLMVIANRLLRGVWKSTVVLWALVAGSLIYYGVTGFPQKNPVTEPADLSLFIFPLQFDTGVLLSFLFCYIALLVNELGSVQSVGNMLKADKMAERSRRAVGITGLLNIGAGSMGIIGPVDYSLSPGIIAATGCASRYPLIPAGAGLILCSFFPGLIDFLSSIPSLVMGAVLLYLMATQLSAALQMAGTGTVISDFNSGIIVGLPLMIALLLSFAPQEAVGKIPAVIRPLAGNGFVMGVIAVLILEHIVFRKNKNR